MLGEDKLPIEGPFDLMLPYFILVFWMTFGLVFALWLAHKIGGGSTHVGSYLVVGWTLVGTLTIWRISPYLRFRLLMARAVDQFRWKQEKRSLSGEFAGVAFSDGIWSAGDDPNWDYGLITISDDRFSFLGRKVEFELAGGQIEKVCLGRYFNRFGIRLLRVFISWKDAEGRTQWLSLEPCGASSNQDMVRRALAWQNQIGGLKGGAVNLDHEPPKSTDMPIEETAISAASSMAKAIVSVPLAVLWFLLMFVIPAFFKEAYRPIVDAVGGCGAVIFFVAFFHPLILAVDRRLTATAWRSRPRP